MFETAVENELKFAKKTFSINDMETILANQGWASNEGLHFANKKLTSDKAISMMENNGWTIVA